MFLTTKNISSGSSSLRIAAYLNNITASKIMLSHGADVNLSDNYGVTPLHIAAAKGLSDIVSLLLQHGAGPLLRNNIVGNTPAMLAALNGHIECLEILFKLDDSSFGPNMWGQTLLHLAATKSPKAMSLILTHGLNPYDKDNAGLTAVSLGFGSSKRSPNVSSFLCNWDLDFDRLPGLISNCHGPQPTILKLLLRRWPENYIARELDTSIYPYLKRTLLSRAAAQNSLEIMEILIKAGASLEADIQDQGTPLIVACSMGRFAAVKCLIRAGAKISGTKGGKPHDALQAAKAFPEIIRWLLVQQYTEQDLISSSPFDEIEPEVKSWSGTRSAEVMITGLYAPTSRESMLDRVFDLVRIRKEFYGTVVPVYRWPE